MASNIMFPFMVQGLLLDLKFLYVQFPCSSSSGEIYGGRQVPWKVVIYNLENGTWKWKWKMENGKL